MLPPQWLVKIAVAIHIGDYHTDLGLLSSAPTGSQAVGPASGLRIRITAFLRVTRGGPIRLTSGMRRPDQG